MVALIVAIHPTLVQLHPVVAAEEEIMGVATTAVEIMEEEIMEVATTAEEIMEAVAATIPFRLHPQQYLPYSRSESSVAGSCSAGASRYNQTLNRIHRPAFAGLFH